MSDIQVQTFEVGLPIIDEQHKKLIGLSNGLLQAMVNGMGLEVLDEIFIELRDYIVYHFDTEERYMQEIGYPGLAEHQACHKQLVEDVDAFRRRLDSGQSVSPKETLDFLNAWIADHIKGVDAKIGKYVRHGEG